MKCLHLQAESPNMVTSKKILIHDKWRVRSKMEENEWLMLKVFDGLGKSSYA